jgi:hypothetical protein
MARWMESWGTCLREPLSTRTRFGRSRSQHRSCPLFYSEPTLTNSARTTRFPDYHYLTVLVVISIGRILAFSLYVQQTVRIEAAVRLKPVKRSQRNELTIRLSGALSRTSGRWLPSRFLGRSVRAATPTATPVSIMCSQGAPVRPTLGDVLADLQTLAISLPRACARAAQSVHWSGLR